ncbi:hypothetical protein DFO61_3370 [Ectopseudomonas oleovorans]|uniref:Uncharacterized protein n=1 Tax=Ectopseudomonas oleovorans TaxID=301 RepID=A0A397MCF7_ECTOL|nr:hypothetical protein [Pseudomonas oleovorans]RIA22680.1 hypothetical protein DFO61_3370 [Pseudomonas oleovorans]
MNSSTTTTASSTLASSALRVLILVALGLLCSFIGFSFGWDAAREAEPQEVFVSFECEPPPVI